MTTGQWQKDTDTLTEIIEENLELKSRVRGLRHQRDEMSSKTENVE